MRKTLYSSVGLVLMFALVLGACTTVDLTLKPDITQEEIARVAISSVQDETLDLLVQCRQYAAVSPDFKAVFDQKLLPQFELVNEYIKTATDFMVLGEFEKIDLNDARVLLRKIFLELEKAKGE